MSYNSWFIYMLSQDKLNLTKKDPSQINLSFFIFKNKPCGVRCRAGINWDNNFGNGMVNLFLPSLFITFLSLIMFCVILVWLPYFQYTNKFSYLFCLQFCKTSRSKYPLMSSIISDGTFCDFNMFIVFPISLYSPMKLCT